MSALFKKRIREIKKIFDHSPVPCGLLISAAPQTAKSRDTNFTYRPSSDFYYLTGSYDDRFTLLISSNRKLPLLISPPHDPVRAVWESNLSDPRQTARVLGAELVISSDPIGELTRQLRGVEVLYHSNCSESLAARFASHLFKRPGFTKTQLPRVLGDSDVVMEQFRLYKDPSEIRLIRSANRITGESLKAALPLIKPGSSESQVANRIDFEFAERGASVGFNSIVATGPSAAVLHYEARTRRLRSGEMLLVDIGAQYQMYCADITRVLPVGGRFSDVQRVVYESVLSAQLAAIKKIKHGVYVKAVYEAAARELTYGLKELGVLRGPIAKLLKSNAYRDYFMHGIGHSLGIDVHDIGNLRANEGARLESGMVFTVEPGLYFPKKIRNIPACGVRIEDNVLVTTKGAEVLSSYFPKEISELEELVGSSAP